MAQDDYTSRQQFTLVLRPDGHATEAEGIRRLKAALKCLLRSYRLRCVEVRYADGVAKVDGTGESEVPQ